mmetsp:Transcript_93068/g.263392  ORF Transcript_93068/g.263392 Transcript_93068/m.263392 type:complete len:88 (-) Transcript_93068:369-632(-)
MKWIDASFSVFWKLMWAGSAFASVPQGARRLGNCFGWRRQLWGVEEVDDGRWDGATDGLLGGRLAGRLHSEGELLGCKGSRGDGAAK